MSGLGSVPVTIFYRDPLAPRASAGKQCKFRNVPQIFSFTAVHLLFIYGGIGFGVSVGYNQFNWITSRHFQYSYLVGLVIGVVVATPFVNFLMARILITLSTLCAITSGILFTSVPLDYESSLAAQYLNGISMGICLLTYLVSSSELSSKSCRGSCLGLEQFFFILGLAVQIICSTQWSDDFPVNRLHGIFGIVLGTLALLTVYFIIESPVYYLKKENEAAALQALKRSVYPAIVNEQLRHRFDRLKGYVRENQNLGFGGAFVQGLGPFLKMICFRSCVALSTALPLQVGFLYASGVSTGVEDNYASIVLACVRVLGALISLSLMEGLGRKVISIFALLVMGSLLIGTATLFGDYANLYDSYKMSVACTLLMLMQFFAGLFAPSTSVFLGEAFPLYIKSFFITLVLAIEQVVHIIIITTLVPIELTNELADDFYNYGLSVGIILIVLGMLFCLCLPETQKTTLNEAQARFKSFLYLKFW